MDNKVIEKKQIRAWAKEIRMKIGHDALLMKSSRIVDKVRKLGVYCESTTVMSYLAKNIEITLEELLKDKDKNWFLPVTLDSNGKKQILAAPYTSETKLTKGKFDILEPEITGDNFFDQTDKKVRLDLIFVPGLCFDKKGNRVGFGKGFYDKFLSLNRDSFKIGLCPHECLVDNVPIGSWDVKVDMVVTD